MSGPIAACATAPFPGAVAVVRISGHDLASRLAPLFRLPEPRMATLRRIRWNGFDERALVLFFPAPASYTGEDLVEAQLHGNPLLVRRFLDALAGLGIRLAEPGEFTRRALLNGKQGLLEVEALRDLMAAATDTQVRMAQARAGGLPPWVHEVKATLAPWIARAEASVDYGEDEDIDLDVVALQADLAQLSQRVGAERRRAEAARWLRDGIRVVLAGRPNAGKSTLFNALAGEDRAIVTDIPGTTRDTLDLRVDVAGLPLLLVDTAGLRDSEDPVERLGVARVEAQLAQADLVLHLIPAGDPGPDPEVLARLAPYAAKVMEVRTQADRVAGALPEGLCVAAAKGDLQALETALRARFLEGHDPSWCLGALATARQRDLLDDLGAQIELLLGLPCPCPPELPASLLQGAWLLLSRLTGDDRAESTLDQVFSGFCLGK